MDRGACPGLKAGVRAAPLLTAPRSGQLVERGDRRPALGHDEARVSSAGKCGLFLAGLKQRPDCRVDQSRLGARLRALEVEDEVNPRRDVGLELAEDERELIAAGSGPAAQPMV
jgi:hypothetical protein